MKLYFINGERKGMEWKLTPPGICIGRENDNDIQLLIPGVSRYHAKLTTNSEGKWLITDLGSTNGTKINGKKITSPEKMTPGMEIMIGEQIIRYDEDSLVQSPTSSPTQIQMKKEEPRNVPPAPAKNIDLSSDIFSKKNHAPNQESAGDPHRKKLLNLLFTVLVAVLICFAGMICVILFSTPGKSDSGQNRKSQQRRNPFILEYEKTQVAKDNVFRFYVRIEEKSAIFKLDDLKHHRHFSKGIGVVEEPVLKRLINSVKETDFMKIESELPLKSNNEIDEKRVLTVGYDNSLNTVSVVNSYPKRSFGDIEYALDRFAEDYGLKTISLSEKEMREEAFSSFRKAEELLANYQARPENLRNAILRYQIAIEFLDQFDPKPEEWEIARRKLSEADKLMKKAIKDAEFNINVLYKKREYAAASAECGKLMLILDPEQKAYQKVRDIKISLEKILSERRKKGKH